jgi:N6-adenosine-specific RNA methylase IME4
MKKYQIVYADPPWDYGNNSFPSTSLKNAYPLMKTEAICALPVKSIVQPNALLFLWTTMTHIPHALRVIDAWGFRYVTNGFTWVKVHEKSRLPVVGMGYWTRQNAELCLVAKRGQMSRVEKAVSSIIIEPRRLHSQKPERVRRDIVRICGDLPRIELFARDKSPGWDIWGNELSNDIDL